MSFPSDTPTSLVRGEAPLSVPTLSPLPYTHREREREKESDSSLPLFKVLPSESRDPRGAIQSAGLGSRPLRLPSGRGKGTPPPLALAEAERGQERGDGGKSCLAPFFCNLTPEWADPSRGHPRILHPGKSPLLEWAPQDAPHAGRRPDAQGQTGRRLAALVRVQGRRRGGQPPPAFLRLLRRRPLPLEASAGLDGAWSGRASQHGAPFLQVGTDPPTGKRKSEPWGLRAPPLCLTRPPPPRPSRPSAAELPLGPGRSPHPASRSL